MEPEFIKRLKEKYGNINLSTPEGWARACGEYAKIVRPGIEAVERLRKNSRANAHKIVVM